MYCTYCKLRFYTVPYTLLILNLLYLYDSILYVLYCILTTISTTERSFLIMRENSNSKVETNTERIIEASLKMAY